jgi:hypothetical protein
MKNLIRIMMAFMLVLAWSHKPSSAQSGGQDHSRQVLGSIQTMEVMYPQQKVYLHLDKDEYVAGETIWFKSYLVNATTHLPDTMKANLYVDVINVQEQPVNVVLLSSENGFADGHIHLPDSLPEGNYLVRGYTTWMHNFDQELFFEKEIFVHNPIEENFINRRGLRQNRRFNRQVERQMETMKFRVFPEGGNLVAGLENRVAFKATNALDKGFEVSGTVRDNSGETLAEFSSLRDGLGMFTFTPEAGKTYRAYVKFENGREMTVDLPSPLKEGYVLRADLVNNEIQVEVRANFNPEVYDIAPEVFLLAQTRSRAYFMENGRLSNGKFQTRIPLNTLPTGVSQITIFDSNSLPLAERLVFVNHQNMTPVSLVTRELVLDNYKALEVDAEIQLEDGPDGFGSYSLAVVESNQELEPATSNMATYLFMTSDLEHPVQAPWSYLSEDTPEMKQALDLVMMTNGWRRFKWKDIIAGEFPELQFGRASGLTIAGKVTPTSSAHPTGEIEVQMIVNQDGRDVRKVETDTEGNFVFPSLYYRDHFIAEFSIPRDPAGRHLRIDLVSRDFREVEYTRSFGTQPLNVVSRGANWERVPQPDAVVRVRRQIERGDDPSKIYGRADQIIYMQDLRTHYSTVFDVLRARLTGFMVVNGQIMLRGPTSVRLSSEPMFMVDGVVTPRNVFLNLPPADLDRIEVLKGSAAAIYGVRGSNGAIIAYTKRGDLERPRTVDFMMIGFQSDKEFATSDVRDHFYRQTNVNRTLFWEPNFVPNEQGVANVVFQLNESPRNLSIILEGIDNNGNVAFKEYRISN